MHVLNAFFRYVVVNCYKHSGDQMKMKYLLMYEYVKSYDYMYRTYKDLNFTLTNLADTKS